MLGPLIFVVLLCSKLVVTDEDVKDFDVFRLFGLFRSLLEIRPEDVKTTDVTFYLYSRNISNLKLPLDGGNIDITKNTKFIIHGWIDNHNRSWYHHLTDEYLKKGDFNVIHVDWGRVSKSFYVSSAQNTRLVAHFIASFILNHKLALGKVHLIGHSLGAHIAGFTSQNIRQKVGEKVGRITGLDPAGPGFRNVFLTDEERLSDEDAEIVDVFHTDGGVLGYYKPIGTFDVYINGGTRIQPDCRISFTEISSAGELFEDSYCSHTRSYVRFTEIVNEKKYSCNKCDSWLEHMVGSCEKNEFYVFGAEDINKTMTGVCFVDTVNKTK
ncbi:endothelial lipase [Tribolium castaneum]|uniref:endothelial lipase n=1 Tax=Tribolium castaneum TaxID=7070 RepID=UPI0030FE1179